MGTGRRQGWRAAWRAVWRGLLVVCALTVIAQAAEAQGARRRGDRNKLTRIELDEAGATLVTARDAVRVLRPQWLQPPRGDIASSDFMGGSGGGATEVVVYIDGIRQPDLDALVTVPAAKLVELRYLDQNRGVQMYGPGHERGVIEVSTTDKRP